MTRKSIRFLMLLLGILLIVFSVHLLVLNALEKPLFENQIVSAYLLNYAMAAIVLFLVERNLKIESAQTGFIFLAGSGLKFLVFFLVFYPNYKADGTMDTQEFATFFVPYIWCLILEVYYLSKQLNNQ
jgi:Family of unknown function (DUF6168)